MELRVLSISVDIITTKTSFILLYFGIFIKFPNVFRKWASSEVAD